MRLPALALDCYRHCHWPGRVTVKEIVGGRWWYVLHEILGGAYCELSASNLWRVSRIWSVPDPCYDDGHARHILARRNSGQ